MKLKTVETPPKDGTQFIASWVYDNVPWSSSYKYVNGELWETNEDSEFVISTSFPVGVSITYQIAEPQPLTTSEILIALANSKILVTEGGTKWILNGHGRVEAWNGKEMEISELIADQPIIKAESPE